MKLILLVSLACYVHLTPALKCYKCFSYKSMEDCVSSQISVDCKSDQPRCKNTTVSYSVKLAFLEENITGYVRGCETEKNCKDKKCEEDFGKKLGVKMYNACDITCCEGDLCPTLNTTESGTDKPAKGKRSAAGRTARGFGQNFIIGLVIAVFLYLLNVMSTF